MQQGARVVVAGRGRKEGAWVLEALALETTGGFFPRKLGETGSSPSSNELWDLTTLLGLKKATCSLSMPRQR